MRTLEDRDENDRDLSAVATLVAEHDAMINTIESCRDAIRRDPNSTAAHIASLRNTIDAHEPALREKYDAVTQTFGTDHQLRSQWSLISAFWEVLDIPIRLRRMEFELKRMDDSLYIRLRDSMTSSGNPVFQFLDVHSGASSGDRVDSMKSLLFFLSTFQFLPDPQIVTIIDDQYEEHLGGGGVADYASNAREARLFLDSLKVTVRAVTESGWPAYAAKPEQPPGRTTVAN
jgi:hypothetical protein